MGKVRFLLFCLICSLKIDSISQKDLILLSFDKIFPETLFEQIQKKAVNLIHLIDTKDYEKELLDNLMDIYVLSTTLKNKIKKKLQRNDLDSLTTLFKRIQYTLNNNLKDKGKLELFNLAFDKILQNLDQSIYNYQP